MCATAPEMLEHLGEHRARGERVPEAAFSELRKEEARDLGQELDMLRLHHTQELVPSKELAEVVGEKPMTRSEMVAKLWAYIRRHELQDAQQKRFVQADEKLRVVLGGKERVTMFELLKLANAHLRAPERSPPAGKE